MFCAPDVSSVMTGSLHGIPSGVAGQWATIRHMRELVRQWKTDPRILNAATSLIFSVPSHDDLSEVRALYEGVRDGIRYQRDVSGIETLATPLLTLQRQVGDCDDQATLLAALFESAGYPTRFVMAGYHDPRFVEHVYTQVLVNGKWLDADPTEHLNLGYSPPHPLRVEYERV
jgi:transglutaminase-like putative cysteine protease